MASDIEYMTMSPLSSEEAEREFVRLLITLYRDNPHLWDNENPHYLHKIKRIRTLKSICDTLKVYRPDYTVEHLKKKINILRTNFNKERHKIETRKVTGTKDGVLVKDPEPGLWYYNELMFLADKKRPPPVRPIMCIPPTSQITKYQQIQKKLKLPDAPGPSIKSQENEADLITKCWAMKLQRLNPDQRMYAEKIINDTLFEAAMGTLTRHGATFVAEPPAFGECSNEESHSPMFKVSPLPE